MPTPPGQVRSFPASATLAWVKRAVVTVSQRGDQICQELCGSGRLSPQEEVAAQEREVQAGTQWVGEAPGLPSHAQRLLPAGQHFRGGKKEKNPTKSQNFPAAKSEGDSSEAKP